jgi:hypothetical protein
MNLKKKIVKWLKITAADMAEIDGYAPKKFGESRSVEFEIDGLVKSFCKVTGWSNGEGFDITFQSKANKEWTDKRIDLHTDELECLFACLNELKHFGE